MYRLIGKTIESVALRTAGTAGKDRGMKEHIITALFKMLCNEIGFERANAIFDQAQINTDYDWPGRAEEAYRITAEHVPALAVCDKAEED